MGGSGSTDFPKGYPIQVSDFLRQMGNASSGSSPIMSVPKFILVRRASRPNCPTPASDSKGCCRSEEHTSELQSLMRISYAVFCLKKKNKKTKNTTQI